jgi:hypothetical protein
VLKWIRAAGGRANGSCSSPILEAYEEARDWIVTHGIFAPSEMGAGRYKDAILAVAP